MMYEDRENDEIIFFKTQKHFSSPPHDWYNHQPLYIFLNCIIDKQNLWEEKSLPYRNKSEKKKGENTSEILTKRRRKDEMAIQKNKKNQKPKEGEVMSEEEDEV